MRGARMRLAVAVAVASLAVFGACWQRSPVAPAERAHVAIASVRPAPGAPFDVRAVIEQVRRAFRRDGAGWSAVRGPTTVRVEAARLHFEAPGRPALTVGPARVTRGAASVGDGPARAGRVARDGTLSLPRGAVVEEFVHRVEGVEQRWRFERPPTGEGDLVVRVPVRGARFRGGDAGGLRFGGGSGEPSLTYGHGTWIDATGARSAVPAEPTPDGVVLRVPARVLLASAYPAVLDPVISAEFGVGAEMLGPAPGDQAYPAIAFDGTNYLVVWNDGRVGYDLFAARVRASDGALLDPTGIPIETQPHLSGVPVVAWNGSVFLVAWSDYRNDTTTSWDLYGARVSAGGEVLDPAGFPIYRGAGQQQNLALASAGGDFLVVWGDSTSKVLGTIVTDQGVTLHEAAPLDFGGGGSPRVASTGSLYLVTYASGGNVYARLASAEGAPQGTAITVSAATGTQAAPDVTYDGTTFVVVWDDERDAATTGKDIYAARVGTDGAVLDTDVNGLVVSTAAGEQRRPRVGSDGTSALVAWEDARGFDTTGWDVYAARVASGAVQDAEGIALATEGSWQLGPAVAGSAAGFVVAFRSSWSSADVHAISVSAAGEVSGTPLVVSKSHNEQTAPDVAFDGTNYLVVWADTRLSPTNSQIWAARVSPAGQVLDADGIAVADTVEHEFRPRVAYGGGVYLVIWNVYVAATDDDVRGAIVGRDGVRGTPFDISDAGDGQALVALASDGTGFLVVWSDARNVATNDWDVYGARVSAEGTVLDPTGLPIGASAADEFFADVAWGGASYLVVWLQGNDMWGVRVGTDGAAIGTPFAVADPTGQRWAPAVASSGAGWLVVYEETRDSSSDRSDVYGTRVSAEGVPLDPAGLAIAARPGYQQRPRVTFDGTSYFVAWFEPPDLLSGGPAYATRVGVDGSNVDSPPLLLTSGAARSVSATSDRKRDVLVAFQRFRPESGSQRVRAVTVGLYNQVPVADAKTVSTPSGTPVAVTLTGSDGDGDPLTFAVQALPQHGTVTGTPPSITYAPTSGYAGADTFTYVATDGRDTSAPATVTVTVSEPDGGGSGSGDGAGCGCRAGGASPLGHAWLLLVAGGLAALWVRRRSPN